MTFKDRNSEEDIEEDIGIYAYVNRRQYNLLITGQATLEIPEGVSMKNKQGTRSLAFNCETRELADILEEALDVSGISWQEGI